MADAVGGGGAERGRMQDARATRVQCVVRYAVGGPPARRGRRHGEREGGVEVLAQRACLGLGLGVGVGVGLGLGLGLGLALVQRTEIEPPGGGPLPAPRAAELHALHAPHALLRPATSL